MEKVLKNIGEYYEKYRYEFYLILLSAAALIVHIHLASTLNLGNDEAHYYVWSLKPSAGYLDDAPFVSYVIYFFTALFGKSELGVRLGAVIFSFLDGFLVYYLTYSLFKNKRASFFAFLFFLSGIIFGLVLSVMMLPDAPLLFFELCFLLFFHKALLSKKGATKNPLLFKIYSSAHSEKHVFSAEEYGCPQGGVVILAKSAGSRVINKSDTVLWILAGLFLGLAFLSKYTSALLPPSALLYLAVSKKNRWVLKTVYPYLALAIALAVFSPVIYWNFTHNLLSFRFQLSHGFSSPKPGFPLFLRGWAGQLLVITPFIYLFLIAAFVYSLKFIPHWFYKKRSGKKLSDTVIAVKAKKMSKFNSGTFLPDTSPIRVIADDGIPESFLYSVCLSFPILLFFILNGYSHKILVHWPDIGYMAAFPIMGYMADKITTSAFNLHTKIFKFIVYTAIFSGFFLSFVLYNQIYYNSIPVGKIIRYIDKAKRRKRGGIFSLIPHIPGKSSTADITNDLFGWRHGAEYIGIVFKGYKKAYAPLFILTHHYAVADELVYYGGYAPARNIYNISGFLNQYDLWQNLNKINGQNAIFIMDNKYMINPVNTYKKYFKSVKKIGRLDIYMKFRPVRIYYLYLMRDFNAKKALMHIKKRMY